MCLKNLIQEIIYLYKLVNRFWSQELRDDIFLVLKQ